MNPLSSKDFHRIETADQRLEAPTVKKHKECPRCQSMNVFLIDASRKQWYCNPCGMGFTKYTDQGKPCIK
jgi:ribosomal protein S27AE